MPSVCIQTTTSVVWSTGKNAICAHFPIDGMFLVIHFAVARNALSPFADESGSLHRIGDWPQNLGNVPFEYKISEYLKRFCCCLFSTSDNMKCLWRDIDARNAFEKGIFFLTRFAIITIESNENWIGKLVFGWFLCLLCCLCSPKTIVVNYFSLPFEYHAFSSAAFYCYYD